MAAKSSRLPPEIIAEIVGFVSTDRETLLSCALVCQDWMSESRTFLFRDIDVYSHETFRSFVSIVLHCERLRPWLTKTRDISIEVFDSIGEGGEPEAFISDISECLPGLRTMALASFPRGVSQKVHPQAPLRTDLFPALGQFAFLYQLDLDCCAFASFGELKSVLVALPALSSLSIFELSCPDSGEPAQSSAPAGPYARPALSHLSATELKTIGDKLYDWLSNTPTRSMLRELSLDFDNIVAGLQMTAGPLSSLASLTVKHMESAGRSGVLGKPRDRIYRTIYLTLPVCPFQADPRFARLSQLLSGKEDIKLLRLHADFIWRGFSWGEMACVLRSFASAGAVRVLRLCCCPHYFADEDDEEFYTGLEQLDPILEGGAFSSLEAVRFALFLVRRDEELPEKHDQVSAWLRRKLPSLHERRVRAEVHVYK